MNQESFFDIIFNKKKNVYISGIGGTGKSYQIKKIYEESKKMNRNSFLTSTTGISSFLIGGTTIHSFSGVILPQYIDTEKEFIEYINKMVKKIKSNNKLLKRWKEIDMLIIDEVSMLGLNYGDLLNCIAKILKNNNKPFGGIQLILSGDMCQLPPINDGFIFESNTWNELDLVNINLRKAWRYTDKEGNLLNNYIELLQRLRLNNQTKEDIEILKSRMIDNFKKEDYEDSIHIFSNKKDVDNYNKNKLDCLKSLTFIIKSQDIYKDKNKDILNIYDTRNGGQLLDKNDIYKKDYDNIFTCPKILNLKINCLVMLLVNLNIEEGLVNGSVGIIKNFIEDDNGQIDKIEIYFTNIKKIYTIQRNNFIYEDNDMEISRFQFPLILSYANTIHKLQGSTVDKIVIDIGDKIFENGQTYVALSRCKDINGLFIKNLSVNKIKTNMDCVKFEKNLLKNCFEFI
jgi:ATP-dependent DNA helicase PIF1